jgi:hypothetical protein
LKRSTSFYFFKFILQKVWYLNRQNL